jgi:glyoxylase-like metal-dependent hydrolase (beta-lactamase superfamily II)
MNLRLPLLAIVVVVSLVSSAQTQTAEPLRPEWCRQLPRPEYKTLERITSADPWFEVYRIVPGVYAIYEPHQFEEVISHLILGDKRALLLDTGLGVGDIGKVVHGLSTLPVTVLNTHTHFDHVGGNSEFGDILAEDTPFTRDNEKGQINKYSRDALAPERICGSLPPGVQADRYAIQPWHVAQRIHDGQKIDLGGRELEILFTPGHTPDSLSLLDRKNGLLFTGDTFYRGPIYLFTPETDFGAFSKSVDRLAALVPNLKLLLPAHNTPTAEPAYLTRLQEAVRKVESGSVRGEVTSGYREYSFDGFSLLLATK